MTKGCFPPIRRLLALEKALGGEKFGKSDGIPLLVVSAVFQELFRAPSVSCFVADLARFPVFNGALNCVTVSPKNQLRTNQGSASTANNFGFAPHGPHSLFCRPCGLQVKDPDNQEEGFWFSCAIDFVCRKYLGLKNYFRQTKTAAQENQRYLAGFQKPVVVPFPGGKRAD